jgi:tetrahydromethanopterin S-methyltransferase subunit C
MTVLISAVATLALCFVIVPTIFWLLQFFGFYAIVEERTCYVLRLSTIALPST